ncbi:MAG: ATP synthase subunit C [Oscillospiraceae bacterium]|nr:ATP synthase subunit C [Oscillospiraceae bacterium]
MFLFALPLLFFGLLALPFLPFKGGVTTKKQAKRRFACNACMFALLCVFSISFALSSFSLRAEASVDTPTTVNEQAPEEETAAGAITGTSAQGMGFLAAALVTGLASLGAGIAVAAGAPAAIGAISENPKSFGKAIIFVVLGEGIAVYGLLISILIINKL